MPRYSETISSMIAWKLHRFFLKIWFGWRNLHLPDGRGLRVKYFAEGKYNYLFRVQGDSGLLRIARKQYYSLHELVDEQVTVENARLMNSLAEDGLSVHCRHLVGGASIVDDAGERVRRGMIDRKLLSDFFARLKLWSVKQGRVILDYNEGNWCIKDGVLRFVDVDVNYTCPLGDIRNDRIVQNRIQGIRCDTDEQALSAFLAREEELYWRHLSSW